MKDDKLITDIKYWVNRERDALEKVISHLRLVQDRRLHLKMGYSSLFQFAVKELGYSETSAQRRVAVVRPQMKLPDVLKEKGHNLSTLGLIEKLGREASAQECQELLDKTRGMSVREAEIAIRGQLKLPQRRQVLKIEVEDSTLELWKQVKGKLAHKNLSEDQILAALCAGPLRQKDVKAKESRQAPGTRLFGAVIRRQAMEKAGGRCEFVSTATGRRCDSVHALECDHVTPWSKGGKTTASNVRVLCRNHNRFVWR
jgi:HNH endonuclease